MVAMVAMDNVTLSWIELKWVGKPLKRSAGALGITSNRDYQKSFDYQ